MTLDWGYLAGTALFSSLLVVLVGAQIRAKARCGDWIAVLGLPP
ncbi:MAG: hypothetical protein ACREFL_19035 [Stellaceae bacterium]